MIGPVRFVLLPSVAKPRMSLAIASNSLTSGRGCPAVYAYPTNLQLTDDDVLHIQWSDGQRREYTVRELRNSCPCATCRDRRGHATESTTQLPVLSLEEARPLRITGMKPVGNYAYTIVFSDGHDTGIYTLEQLRETGHEMEG